MTIKELREIYHGYIHLFYDGGNLYFFENKLRDVGTFGSWEDKKFQGYDDLEIGVIRISQHQQNTLVVAGYSKSTELPPKGYMIPTSNH